MVVLMYLIFFIAPVPIDPMEAGGDPINFKILYFHVPIAVTAYLAFAIAFILLMTSLIILRMESEKLSEEIAFIKCTKNL